MQVIGGSGTHGACPTVRYIADDDQEAESGQEKQEDGKAQQKGMYQLG